VSRPVDLEAADALVDVPRSRWGWLSSTQAETLASAYQQVRRELAQARADVRTLLAAIDTHYAAKHDVLEQIRTLIMRPGNLAHFSVAAILGLRRRYAPCPPGLCKAMNAAVDAFGENDQPEGGET